jgi:hypothetical protein
MSETVEAIQEKLRPSNIVSEGTEAIKNAVTERVGDMTDTASRTAQDFLEGTRQNPLPALMIGAGVAWMLYDRTRGGSRYDGYGTGTRRTSGVVRTSSPDQHFVSGTEYGTGRTSGANMDESSYGRHAGSYGSYGSYNEGRSMQRMTRNAQTGLQRMLHENPLLVGAAAILAGAAIGGALPQTEKENDLMGDARDRLVDRGKEAAREATDSVREVAQAVQDVAGHVTRGPSAP